MKKELGENVNMNKKESSKNVGNKNGAMKNGKKSAKSSAKQRVSKGARSLSEKQRKFCRALLAGLLPEEAALAAGYMERTAAQYAKRNLALPAVVAELERLHFKPEVSEAEQGEMAKAAEGVEILQFLTAVMRGEVQDGDESGGKGKPPKVSERTKAAELLGRNQRLFSDKEKSDGAVVRIFGADELI